MTQHQTELQKDLASLDAEIKVQAELAPHPDDTFIDNMTVSKPQPPFPFFFQNF
jgi:hypothetical protein